MAMVVPRAKQDKRPQAPPVPPEFLAMAAATMAQQGKLNQDQPAQDGVPTS